MNTAGVLTKVRASGGSGVAGKDGVTDNGRAPYPPEILTFVRMTA